MKNVSQLHAGLDAHETEDLAMLCRRSRPCVAVTMDRMETDGLVEFTREDRRGRTWYRATPLGRAVSAYAQRRAA